MSAWETIRYMLTFAAGIALVALAHLAWIALVVIVIVIVLRFVGVPI